MINRYLIDVELYLLTLLVILCDYVLDPSVVLPLLNKRRILLIIIEAVVPKDGLQGICSLTVIRWGGNYYWARFVVEVSRNLLVSTGSPCAVGRTALYRR